MFFFCFWNLQFEIIFFRQSIQMICFSTASCPNSKLNFVGFIENCLPFVYARTRTLQKHPDSECFWVTHLDWVSSTSFRVRPFIPSISHFIDYLSNHYSWLRWFTETAKYTSYLAYWIRSKSICSFMKLWVLIINGFDGLIVRVGRLFESISDNLKTISDQVYETTKKTDCNWTELFAIELGCWIRSGGEN